MKSTVAYQFSKSFTENYDNGLVVFLDIEGSGNVEKSDQFKVSRIESFGLDARKFKYEPLLLNVMQVFELVEKLIEAKNAFEQKTGKEFFVGIVWDSIPSTPSDKAESAEDANKVIGLKARQLSFCLEKYNPMLKINKISMVAIDQVRADIKIDGPYAAQEKSVGSFKNMKTATNIYALQHNVQQWLFFSKKAEITETEGMGVNGWYLDIFTEKNKLAPSKFWVTCVFDTMHGIDKFWSEYTFLAEPTPTEKKVFVYKKKKLPFPLCITKSGNQVQLNVKNPDDPAVEYKSGNFFRRDAKKKYETDPEFKQWFDYAVDMSVYYRIRKGVFKVDKEEIKEVEGISEEENTQEEVPTASPENVAFNEDGAAYNSETGEVY